MKVGFRVDASSVWGTGHVMRCLTLAGQLCKQGAEPFFMCKRLKGDLVEYIKEQGYPVYELPGGDEMIWKEDADQVIQILKKNKQVHWLVMDHYLLDAKWGKVVSPYVQKLMVIDDLANRPHVCDSLLDQNLYRDMEQRYDGLIPEGTDLLLGPVYTLLREEFISRGPLKDSWDGRIRHILVSFGGSDPTNETMKTLKAVSRLSNKPKVDVVIGQSYPYQKEIIPFCRENKWVDLHIQTRNIALFMEKADLVIGAGGSSVWERCYMKLPSLIIETASNQSEIISLLTHKGAVVYLGKSDEVNSDHIAKRLQEIMDHPDHLESVRQSVKEIMKHHQPYGVSEYMMGGVHLNKYRLRPVERRDLHIIWKWRNAEHIRKNMYNDNFIPWEEHTAWFEKEENNTTSSFHIFIYQERPLGVVRFTNIDNENGTCEWGFYIGDQSSPKGSGTIMGMLALDLIFKNHNLRKVCAEVLDINVASFNYHQKLGFVQEGKLIHQIKRGDQLIDVIPMGLFKDTWEMRRKTLIRGQEDGN